MASLSENRGCETCKARKIRCDRGRPVCANCRRSRRTCVAHTLRLSWPTSRDRRRFVAGPDPNPTRRGAQAPDYHFLNISTSQVEQYLTLSNDGTLYVGAGMITSAVPRTIPQNPSMKYTALQTTNDGEMALSFFYRVAAKTLPAIEGTGLGFRDLLMKMALSDNSPSSRAVLFSILSLATLHRPGSDSEEVFRFKARTFQALKESASKRPLDAEGAMQHLAATIILCRVEIGLAIAATSLWCLFVCGASSFMEGLHKSMNLLPTSEDVKLLYRYVHYHNLMSSFGLRHWKREAAINDGSKIDFRGQVLEFKCRKTYYIPDFQYYVSEGSQLLADVLDLKNSPGYDEYHPETYQARLESLESRMASAYCRATKRLRQASQSTQPSAPRVQVEARKRLFISATWIYFLRTAWHLVGPSPTVDILLRDAFDANDTTGIPNLDSCNLPFVLFILGCEATSEERRRAVLDLIRRTVALSRDGDGGLDQSMSTPSVPSRPLGDVRGLLEAVWAMEDLHANNEAERQLVYEHKLHLVFSASEILPALV